MQGYVHVYTGDGKGKTTAALGLAIRAAGAGLKIYIGQFIKSAEYSEIKALNRFSEQITLAQFGRGCFIKNDPTDEDIDLAQNGLKSIEKALCSGDFNLVIADEANVAIGCKLVTEADLLNLIKIRPASVELVLTGRNAPASVIEQADLVTEMREVKHYYQQGVMARDGIER